MLLTINIFSQNKEMIFSHTSSLFIELSDVNGDGIDDIIGNNYFGRPEIFISDGDFTFLGPREIKHDEDYGLASDFCLIDFDNDGDQDMINTGCSTCNFKGINKNKWGIL